MISDHRAVSGRVTTRLVLAGWAVAVTTVGFAQLFRTHLEQATGLAYIVGGLCLVSAIPRLERVPAAVGYAVIGSAFLTRAVSAPAPTWHGRIIIAVTWSGLAVIAWSRARNIARGEP